MHLDEVNNRHMHRVHTERVFNACKFSRVEKNEIIGIPPLIYEATGP